jgi:DNA-binding transcriptional regulator YiaG
VTYRKEGSGATNLDLRGRGRVDVTSTSERSGRNTDLDLVDLRRSLGGLTQVEAARLLNVTANTWARWERGVLQLHPARTYQLHRLHQLVRQYGEGPFWGLGIDGVRSVIDGLSVPEALDAHGLDARGAPLRH